jgi:hypothetical protein
MSVKDMYLKNIVKLIKLSIKVSWKYVCLPRTWYGTQTFYQFDASRKETKVWYFVIFLTVETFLWLTFLYNFQALLFSLLISIFPENMIKISFYNFAAVKYFFPWFFFYNWKITTFTKVLWTNNTLVTYHIFRKLWYWAWWA